MTVDPTDPETFDDENEEPGEIGVEEPDADAAEQYADVAPERDDSLTGVEPDRASEGDLAEQARVVRHDEDDYR
ncbi:hypothetical protein [Streptomyces sp. AD55]|uniref:hypothetical protein n=1 Tax=Streptomyces sp. AD55 TaxID=3242895 RepID=UPI00352830F6